jgi:hypothetical protein
MLLQQLSGLSWTENLNKNVTLNNRWLLDGHQVIKGKGHLGSEIVYIFFLGAL